MPTAWAASTNSRLRRLSTSARLMRTKCGMNTSTMASMATNTLPPSTLTITSASSSGGIDSTLSMARITTASVKRPNQPARRPSGTPISSAPTDDMTPTARVMREA